MFAMTACGGGSSMPPPLMAGQQSVTQARLSVPMADTDTSVDRDDEDEGGDSVLKRLDDQRTIGSTIPSNGDQNPYGLDVAKSDAGLLETGDLVVCNFNNSANIQGTGTTIIALHAHPGSKPRLIAQNSSLLGCDALAVGPTDNPWAAAFAANDNPIFSPSGALLTTLAGGPWHHPFGQIFAQHDGPFGSAAFYESNAGDGSIVRINLPSFTFDVIAKGFPINGGAPGSILGPSGLQYESKHDRLYIVDGTNNTVYALRHVSTIPAGGITVTGTSFSGPFRQRARVVFSGPPLNGPISSALLANGHLVLGNTLDANGKNLMVEVTSHGRLLFVRNVDTGAAGSIFGMVATGRDADDTKLYFNDDNMNTVQVLTR